MRRLFAVAVISFALLGVAGCSSDKPKDDKATTHACTKCKCANWTDENKDGKCDTQVDGKACDHTAADHGVASK